MNINTNIAVNTRILDNNLTGVPRYALELLSRLGNNIQEIKPDRHLIGMCGHAWEQFVLPNKLNGALLWSPSNTGPLAIGRQVLTLHDVVPMDHPEWLNSSFAMWYRFLTPKLVRRVHSILTISEFTKQRIIFHSAQSESKIKVVYNGVDRRFQPVGADKIQEASVRLAIPSPHYLLALGSLAPRKNLSRLLQAWAAIQSRIPKEVWLVIAGAKGCRLVFGDISFDNLPPRVHLTGHVPDEMLPALYSGAIAAPYLSVYEGFGLPPLEAMACGTPPLTGNLASLPEVVGDAGLMVDPYDVDAIADGLLRLVDDAALRSDLTLKGLERVKFFNWEKTAQMTWQVLKEAAESY
jgi:glycosyltransferase involved in cell wall biosynthesis